MPTYAYRAIEDGGKLISGALTAENHGVALRMLDEKALHPISVEAFAVAASDDQDMVLSLGNSNAQTDLFAPGDGIRSTGEGGSFNTISGTSQATALTSACVAALLEAFPNSTPGELAQALIRSPTEVDRDPLSFPRLDCADALMALPEPNRTWLLAVALATLSALARRQRPPRR